MGLTKEKMFIILKKFAKQAEKDCKKGILTRRKLYEEL
jgi:hypothetical protein